jgi:hypothetical protein
MDDAASVNGEYFVSLARDYKTVQQYFADRNISMQHDPEIAEGQPPLSHVDLAILRNSRETCHRVLAFASVLLPGGLPCGLSHLHRHL